MSFRKGTPVIAPVVNCHVYNANGSMCAVCPNTRDILIYATNKSEEFTKWKLLHTLQEHHQKVTAMDWGKQSNKILSCSEDRNAYVWSFDESKKKWKPTLVLVRINRAALCCKWSPAENKFAVGSGSKSISVCFFGKEQNWWVSNIVKKRFRSSVTSLSWHPTDNTILAAGSTDGHCRVVSTFLKKLDPKESKKGPFGKVLADYEAGSWVHDVKFSPSGNYLGYIAHNSSVYIAPAGEEPYIIRSKYLPFRSMLWLSEEKIICAGWNYSPIIYVAGPDGWTEERNMDEKKKKAVAQTSNVRSAFNKFQKSATVGGRGSTVVATRHKNVVNDIVPYGQKISTSGLDGRIFFWQP